MCHSTLYFTNKSKEDCHISLYKFFLPEDYIFIAIVLGSIVIRKVYGFNMIHGIDPRFG